MGGQSQLWPCCSMHPAITSRGRAHDWAVAVGRGSPGEMASSGQGLGDARRLRCSYAYSATLTLTLTKASSNAAFLVSRNRLPSDPYQCYINAASMPHHSFKHISFCQKKASPRSLASRLARGELGQLHRAHHTPGGMHLSGAHHKFGIHPATRGQGPGEG